MMPRHFAFDRPGRMRDGATGQPLAVREFLRQVRPGDTFERQGADGNMQTVTLRRKVYVDQDGQETDVKTARGRCVLVSRPAEVIPK